MVRLSLITAAILAATSAAADHRKGDAVCVWGKTGTLITDAMPSGRPGYDALYVRWADGRDSFVLVPKGREPGCDAPAR